MNSTARLKPSFSVIAILGWLAAAFVTAESAHPQSPDQDPETISCFSIKADLVIPGLSTLGKGEGRDMNGKRFKSTLEGFDPKMVFHVTYLPSDWKPDAREKWPVIIELTGNGPYRNRLGDSCTGKVEDAKLGYGISGGKGFIWVCVPFLDDTGKSNVTRWWGNRPTYSPLATVNYVKRIVPQVCERWGGDSNRVCLVGFSRGAIACNFIGLYDDEIAKLWCGFVAFSHYDGVNESWPYPDDDRKAALNRLRRLGKRPQFICAEGGAGLHSVGATRQYLKSQDIAGNFTFATIGVKREANGITRSVAFRNHDDAWILRPSATRDQLRKWVDQTCGIRRD